VSASNNTRYGDSPAAKSLFEIVYEQAKPKSVNRRVSAFLSSYSHTASQLEQMPDPHTVGTMQKMLMHSSTLNILENFGNGVLATHLCNVLKIRYRQFERRARERVKEASRKKKLDGCSMCKGAKGGAPGNENVVNGVVVCDYCHVDSASGTYEKV
jgi:hypothetical protein